LNFGANFDYEVDDARNYEEKEASTVRTSRCPYTKSGKEEKRLDVISMIILPSCKVKLNYNNQGSRKLVKSIVLVVLIYFYSGETGF
jgi:hypothetical protein